MTSRAPSRLLGLARAFLLSWVAVTLAALAHVAMGGSAPSPSVAILVGLALAVVGMPWCRRAFDLTRAAPLLLGQQLVVHVALTLTGGAGGHGSSVQPTPRLAALLDGAHAGHSVGGGADAAGGSGLVTLGHGSAGTVGAGHQALGSMTHSLLPSPAMLLGHLVAAVVVALILAGVEDGARGLQALSLAREQLGHWVRTVARRLLAPAMGLVALATAGAGTLLLISRRVAGTDFALLLAPGLTDLWRSPAPCRRGPPALRAA